MKRMLLAGLQDCNRLVFIDNLNIFLSNIFLAVNQLKPKKIAVVIQLMAVMIIAESSSSEVELHPDVYQELGVSIKKYSYPCLGHLSQAAELLEGQLDTAAKNFLFVPPYNLADIKLKLASYHLPDIETCNAYIRYAQQCLTQAQQALEQNSSYTVDYRTKSQAKIFRLHAVCAQLQARVLVAGYEVDSFAKKTKLLEQHKFERLLPAAAQLSGN